MAMVIEVCCSSHSLRYFSALSKGEPLPVKERIELSLATEEKDAGLTPGLLKVLHKQVQELFFIKCATLLRNADVLEMVGEREHQVFEVFWGDTVFLNSFWFLEFLL